MRAWVSTPRVHETPRGEYRVRNSLTHALARAKRGLAARSPARSSEKMEYWEAIVPN